MVIEASMRKLRHFGSMRNSSWSYLVQRVVKEGHLALVALPKGSKLKAAIRVVSPSSVHPSLDAEYMAGLRAARYLVIRPEDIERFEDVSGTIKLSSFSAALKMRNSELEECGVKDFVIKRTQPPRIQEDQKPASWTKRTKHIFDNFDNPLWSPSTGYSPYVPGAARYENQVEIYLEPTRQVPGNDSNAQCFIEVSKDDVWVIPASSVRRGLRASDHELYWDYARAYVNDIEVISKDLMMPPSFSTIVAVAWKYWDKAQAEKKILKEYVDEIASEISKGWEQYGVYDAVGTNNDSASMDIARLICHYALYYSGDGMNFQYEQGEETKACLYPIKSRDKGKECPVAFDIKSHGAVTTYKKSGLWILKSIWEDVPKKPMGKKEFREELLSLACKKGLTDSTANSIATYFAKSVSAPPLRLPT